MNIEANAGDGEKVALGRVVIAVLGNGWHNGQTKSATVNDIILSIREGKYDPNLGKRLDYHNKGKVKSTKAYRPWKIIYVEEFENKREAYGREMQIKSYKGGNAFKKLICWR